MPASELKHVTLDLIEKGTPVVVHNPSGENNADSLSNVEELAERRADVIGKKDEDHCVYREIVRCPRLLPK